MLCYVIFYMIMVHDIQLYNDITIISMSDFTTPPTPPAARALDIHIVITFSAASRPRHASRP